MYRLILAFFLLSTSPIWAGTLTKWQDLPQSARSQTQSSGTFLKGLGADNNWYAAEVNASTGAVTVANQSVGTATALVLRNAYASQNVTTGAYVPIVSGSAVQINHIWIFDSSGSTMKLATAATSGGVQVDQIYYPPGGGDYSLQVASGAYIYLKAIDANATTGEVVITGLQ